MNLLDILFQDASLLIVNKPAGVPVQPDPSGDRSLSDAAKQALGEGSSGGRGQKPAFLGIPHRIDRPVSGAVLFARSPRMLADVNRMLRDGEIRKVYLAAVDAPPPEPQGELVHWIVWDRKRNKSFARDAEVPGAKEAVLRYRTLGSSDRYVFLEIELITGRHHQIRAQLARIGCRIKGDLKYGASRSNPGGGIHLHAWKLSFLHPLSGEPVSVRAPMPEDPVWNHLAALLEGGGTPEGGRE